MQFSIADAVFDSGFRPPAADAVFDRRCSFLSQMQFSIADAVFYLRCSFRSQKASCKYSAYFRFTDTTDPYRVLTITETKTHYRSILTDTDTSSTRHRTGMIFICTDMIFICTGTGTGTSMDGYLYPSLCIMVQTKQLQSVCTLYVCFLYSVYRLHTKGVYFSRTCRHPQQPPTASVYCSVSV
jgi:hypothetical protein